MDRTGDHCVKQNKPDSKRPISHHRQNLDLKKYMDVKEGLFGGRRKEEERMMRSAYDLSTL
jgi:hypothetical protein